MLWRKALTYWKSTIVAAIIAYGCLLRKPLFTVPPIDGGDKWVHWLVFMILTLTLLWDSHKAGLQSWKQWVIAIALPIIYGGLIEILQQQFFYPRTGEWLDWLADGVGVLIGSTIWLIAQKIHERRMAQ